MKTTTLATRSERTLEASTPRPDWLSARVFPFQSRFVKVGAVRFHYVDEGTGPTLLFLHGSPLSTVMYRSAIQSLRSRFRCIGVDLPGMGLSTSPIREGSAFESNAAAYQGFVQALGLNDLTLIMHSTSGPSALEMAVRERKRLSGLVISNTFGWALGDVPQMRRIVQIVSSRLFRFLTVRFNFLARVAARFARTNGRFTGEERTAVLGPYEGMEPRRHLANLLYGLRVEAPFFRGLGVRIETLRGIPTLLLYGGKDAGYRAGFVDRWRELLPASQVSVIQSAGHFLTEDEPEAYTEHLTSFLNELEPELPSE